MIITENDKANYLNGSHIMSLKTTFLLTLFLHLLFASLLSNETSKSDKYTFTAQPTLTMKDKDIYEVSFTVKEFCDVAVYVKDNDNKTIRHIGGGLLGAKSPAPFLKNSKEQKIIWDGKDDYGKLVDNFENLQIVVCLGLKAQFERTHYWSPYKRTKDPFKILFAPLMHSSPEGVVVFDGGSSENLRLYDHNGVYLKTIFPFPNKSVNETTGLLMKKYPQDNSLMPLKGGMPFNNLLSTFSESTEIKWEVRGGENPKGIAVFNNQIILADKRLNIINAKENKIAKIGIQAWQPVTLGAMHEYAGGTEKLGPESLAVSNDGKWLYMTGYFYQKSWLVGGINGVMKTNLQTKEAPILFVGEMTNKTTPNKPESFDLVSCVAVDKKNNVYVGDYGNQRIQVFKEDGTLLKSIPATFPTFIQIDPNTQEIYVFAWGLPYSGPKAELAKKLKPSLQIIKSLEEPTVTKTYNLPLTNVMLDGLGARVTVDFWGEEKRIWLSDPATTAPWISAKQENANIKIYRMKEKDLDLVKDFHEEAKKDTAFTRSPRHGKQRLFFDYKNENLYVGELFAPTQIHCTSMADVTQINANTGADKFIKLPYDAEDMAFDINGLAYLRTKDKIARFETINWKEVPFDYGNEIDKLTTWDIYKRDVVSAIPFISDYESSSQLGGMCISPNGNIAVTIFNAKQDKNRGLNIYPGRSISWQIQIWNSRGQLMHEDAVGGLGRLVGLNMDINDNIYMMVAGRGRSNGEIYYHPISCTYVKTKPKSRFINSEAVVPIPDKERPQREPEILEADFAGNIWIEGSDWYLGGVGFDGKRNKCHCPSQSRPALDLYARSFLPEVDRYSVLVVDSSGNEILRIGRYGNIEDGLPLIKDKGPANPVSIGGDEVAIMHAQMLALQSNKRLFISDLGNARVLSVLLNYHETKSLKVKP